MEPTESPVEDLVRFTSPSLTLVGTRLEATGWLIALLIGMAVAAPTGGNLRFGHAR